MNEIRDILGRALPDQQPPTSITSESVAVAGERLRRRNRGLAAAGAAGLAVVLVLGAVAWAQVVRPGGGGLQAGTVGSPSTSSATSLPTFDPSAPPSPFPTPYPTETATPTPSPTASATKPAHPGVDPQIARLLDPAPQLTTALLDATHAVAPGVHIGGVNAAFAGVDLAPYETVKSQGGIKTYALLSDANGPGTVFLDFSQGGDPSAAPNCNSQPNCIARVGPNGEPIVINQGSPGNGVKVTTVSLTRTDGTQIYLQLENYSQNDQPTTKTGMPYGQRSTQILTVDQMVQILLAPGVTIPPGLDLTPPSS
jgi:hypothetical protein